MAAATHLLDALALQAQLERCLGVALHIQLVFCLELLAEVVKQQLVDFTAAQVAVPCVALHHQPTLLEADH